MTHGCHACPTNHHRQSPTTTFSHRHLPPVTHIPTSPLPAHHIFSTPIFHLPDKTTTPSYTILIPHPPPTSSESPQRRLRPRKLLSFSNSPGTPRTLSLESDSVYHYEIGIYNCSQAQTDGREYYDISAMLSKSNVCDFSKYIFTRGTKSGRLPKRRRVGPAVPVSSRAECESGYRGRA